MLLRMRRQPSEDGLPMNVPVVDFWFEFASTYSYPAAFRIGRLASAAGVGVRWRPFLLGPIFAVHGWNTSPFNLYPAKGRYMWRDVERVCAGLGLAFHPPDPFPQSSLLAARVALVGLAQGWGEEFVQAVYRAEFAAGRQIGERIVIAELLASLDIDPEPVLMLSQSDDIKNRLRAETEEARQMGVFGAPSFTAGAELFWGNDRLEAALAWAKDADPP
jgi:2-hydroxychromene-2-carboxylate isomerase